MWYLSVIVTLTWAPPGTEPAQSSPDRALPAPAVISQSEGVPGAKVAPSTSVAPDRETAASSPSRLAAELRKAVHEALKVSAPNRQPDWSTVVPPLCDLYGMVSRDTYLVRDDRLYLRGLLRSRLMTVQGLLEKQIASAATAPRPPWRRVDAAVTPTSAGGDRSTVPDSAAANRDSAAGGSGVRDHGPELVELIKRTIAPNSWDDAGGLGSIYYYRPFHALVIRQTGHVHEQLGDVFQQLRRN